MKDFWDKRKIFVTGGNGFIGTWLVKQLVEKNAEVHCLVMETNKDNLFNKFSLDRKTHLIFGDMLDKELINLTLNKNNIEFIFHLAAQPLVQIAMKNPYETIKNNIFGTLNILECSRLNSNIKSIVIASSDKAYGSSNKLPYDETFPLKGEYPYDVSKSCTDLVSQAYAKTYNLPLGITRFSNVYGGGDLNFDRIIPETIKHLLFDEEIIIRSDGKFLREFFYVKDAANAYLTLAENVISQKLMGEAFNFGTDEKYMILDLVNKMVKISGKKNAKIKILNIAKAEIRDQFLSSKKAKDLLDWMPKYNIEEGLKETFNWYKDHFKK